MPPKYEYKTVMHPTALNTGDQAKYDVWVKDTDTVLNSCGNEGWELVSATVHQNKYQYFFKRELQQEPCVTQVDKTDGNTDEILSDEMNKLKVDAEMGIKRVALEFKVEELEIEVSYPPEWNYSLDDDADIIHEWRNDRSSYSPEEQGVKIDAGRERAKVRLMDNRRVLKNMKLEALRQCRAFETTKLKELGEDGWTLQKVVKVDFPDIWKRPVPLGGCWWGDSSARLQPELSYTKLYYFSRPL
jgi:hypothetical protein